MRALLLALAVHAPLHAQEVPHESFTLDNGLAVVLHQDNTLPQVVVNLWYRVGAYDDPAGKSGLAHLSEHMMFLGTERAPGSSFDDWMEAGGGYNNAWTSYERTAYYSVGPAELLPTLLWLEADRMEAIAAAVTQEKLDSEREVVRNERRQSYEDVPYGEAYLELVPMLDGRESIIGTHADLRSITVEDVKAFYEEYYRPNNASLVVAGDLDLEETRARIEELFGSISGGHAPRRPEGRARIEEDREATLFDDRVTYPQTMFVWPCTSAVQTSEFAELDLATDLLGAGVSSRLYQTLVIEKELAEEVSAYVDPRLGGDSYFAIHALAREGVELSALEAGIEAVLAALASSGPSEEELSRAQVRYEASFLRELESLEERAEKLNEYLSWRGEANGFEGELTDYREATPDSLKEAFQAVISRPRVIQRVLPGKATADNPRDVIPELADPTPFQLVSPETFTLANGIEVRFWRRPGIPLVELALQFPVGVVHDPSGKAGLATVCGSMLSRGAGERSSAEYQDALDALGAEVTVTVARERTLVHLSGLSRHLTPSLDLFADLVLAPRFEPAEWEQVAREAKARLVQEQQDLEALARRIAFARFFGDGHPYAHPAGGTAESFESIELNDLVAFYSDTFRPDGAVILIAGDVELEALTEALEARLGGWKTLLSSSGQHEPTVPEGTNGAGLRVFLHDVPGATQTLIRFQTPAVPENDPARPAHDLVATILGGTFTSRLNSNLRVERGITYGANANFVRGSRAGYLVAVSRVEAAHTADGVSAFLHEFDRLTQGDISEEEAGKARANRRLQVIQDFAGLDGLIGRGAQLAAGGRTMQDLQAELELVATLDAAALNAVAPAVGSLDGAVLVLVGDASVIQAGLSELDLGEITRVDASGRAIE